MNSTVIFHNPGELDIRAVTTFGLSVKKTDNPIGMFGTGLKYAIAVLLRNGCDIEIFSGRLRYKFLIQQDLFRGQAVRMIYMTGDGADHMPLPFTLELGKHWELWQAYRELYCNAIDEGGGVCDKHESADGLQGHTVVAVKGDAFAKIHENRRKFINSELPIAELGGVNIVMTPGAYLKGIRISDDIYYRPIFGYNFTEGVPLTEDRTLGCAATAESIIRSALAACEDHDLIERILTAEDVSFERQISWSLLSAASVGHVFKRCLLNLSRTQGSKLSSSARALAKALDEKRGEVEPLVLTAVQTGAYERAVVFLAKQGVQVGDYPVQFVVSLGDGVFGQAKAGTIFIAEMAFKYGVKALAATLYEEHMHLSRGWRDCTREMQDHLFHTIIGLWEERSGEAL